MCRRACCPTPSSARWRSASPSPAAMSRSETEHVVGLIRQVTAGKTLLMVEHDMSVVFDLADRIAVLVYGEIIPHDTPERLRANAAVQEAYLGVPQGVA